MQISVIRIRVKTTGQDGQVMLQAAKVRRREKIFPHINKRKKKKEPQICDLLITSK